MTPNERVKLLRKELDLNQEEFGEKIGITKQSVSRIESAVHNLTDRTAKLICKTFNVDYFWLTEGKGEMFTAIPQTLVDSLADQYHLDDFNKLILETYLESSNEQKAALKSFLLTLVEKIKKNEESK